MVFESLSTPLSNVDVDLQRRGYMAVALLDSILKGEEPKTTHIYIPPRAIIHRKSSDIMAVNNKAVIKALQYISLNYASDIAVEQIVSAANVSRRTLELAFKKELGRTINRELLRKRIEEAKVRLKTTDTRIKDVALAVGFNYQQPFYNAFIRMEGCTPRQFRDKN